MKTSVLLLFLCMEFVPGDLSSQTNTNLFTNCVMSAPRSNLFVGFRSPLVRGQLRYESGALVFPADAPLAFGFGTSLDKPLDVIALKKEFGYIISARSLEGFEVEKTSSGRDYGSRINECWRWAEEQFDTTKGQGSLRGAPYLNVAKISTVNFSRRLPPPDDLFHFKKPGHYVLSIEVQCLVAPYGASNPTNAHVVRLPPVSLQVVKEEKE